VQDVTLILLGAGRSSRFKLPVKKQGSGVEMLPGAKSWLIF